MKPAFIAPKGTLEKKPPHGSPCNRCGLCCVATLCPLARVVFGRSLGPCPALSYDADGSRCGLVDEPMKYAMKVTMKSGVEATRSAAKQLIGSSLGCDARFNGEPIDEAFYGRLRDHDRKTASVTRKAKKVWGIA